MISWQANKLGDAKDVVKKVNIDLPEPRENEARIKITATVLGLPDYMMLKGNYIISNSFPISFGQEAVGIVDKAGPGYPYKEGQRVITGTRFDIGLGGLAEYSISPGESAIKAPQGLTDEEAAGFLGSFHVAYVGLVNRAFLKPGETLLILGGSGRTGSSAIQLGKALGATVIATARKQEQASFCLEQGADFVFNPKEQNFQSAIEDFTNGKGINVIYDTVGGNLYKQAVENIAIGGRVVLIGFASGEWGEIDPIHISWKGYSVTGALHTIRTKKEREESIKKLNSLLLDGSVTPLPTNLYNFDYAVKALESLNNKNLGLTIVKMDY